MDIQTGDIYYSSWGYDQTNIDFYQVIATTAKTATIRMIGSERVGSPNIMASYVVPMKDCFLDGDSHYDNYYGAPMRRKILIGYDDEIMLKVGCGIAKKWNGKKKTETYTG